METIIMGIAFLFAAIYLITLVIDIVKTARSKMNSADAMTYKWQSSGFFQECKTWWSVLLLGALLAVGLYSIGSEYAKAKVDEAIGTKAYCEECKRQVPAKYTVLVHDDLYCPSCMEEWYESEIEWYENAMELSGSGMYTVTELETCDICYNYAPSDLTDSNGNNWCITCICKALKDPSVEKALENYQNNLA